MRSPTPAQLTGQDGSHLCHIEVAGRDCRLTPGTARAFQALATAAARDGIELAIASDYRDFGRQLAIWNAKANGQRPVLDRDGQVLQPGSLGERELVFAILRWSALPGASRHHWGCDIDVYDAAAVAPDYQVQLTPAECAQGGVFETLHRWLDRQLAQGDSYGFYRPYGRDRGGVAPEPWHLSCRAEAAAFEGQLQLQRCYDFIAGQPLALRDTVLSHFEEIYTRFVAPG